jgi:hypothetical protein
MAMLRMWMFTSIFTMVFHRILDFKTGLNFYSDPFFMQKNKAAFSDSLYTYQPKFFTNPSSFLNHAALLSFLDFRTDLSFNFCG